jgi:hypothetical protein
MATYPYDPNESPAPGPGEPAPAPPPSATETEALPQTPPVQQTGAPAPSAGLKGSGLSELDVFRDPVFLRKVAQMGLERGSKLGLIWLNHVHTALNENATEALSKLRAGDGEGAVEAFNRSGIHRDAKSATINPDGKTWTLTTVDGRSMTIDPEQEERALMSPLEYAKIQTERAHAASYNAEAKYRNAAAGFTEEKASLALEKLRNEREKAAADAIARVEAARVRGESAAAIRAAQAEAHDAQRKLNDTLSPGAIFKALAEKFSTQPEPDTPPEISAIRVASRSARAMPRMDEQGRVHIVDRNDPNEPIWSFKDLATAQKALPGLYVPQGAAPPKPEPAASRPGNAPPAAPVNPKNARQGMTEPKDALGNVSTGVPEFGAALAADKTKRDAETQRLNAIRASSEYQQARAALVEAVKSGDGKKQRALRQQMNDMLAPK